MRIFVLSILLFHFSFDGALAQSSRTIFKLLPAECTPDLSKAERDSLLKYGQYILPGGDSLETVMYDLDTAYDNYFRYGWSFTTGQRGFLSFQVLTLTHNDGRKIVLYSEYGGHPVEFSQRSVRAFNYSKAKLKEIKEKLLPDTVDLKYFLSPDTPDSMRLRIAKEVNYSYDFNPGFQNTVAYSLYFYGVNEEVNKYVERETIYFRWNGTRFVMEKEPR